MKEMNIAKILNTKRKEKGVTQEELAAYIGVSKASVSKWETGQSYPDIIFLPQLASYFNITVDELMGYEPQMEKEEIARLYHRLSREFVSKPPREVVEECYQFIRKYYSCFPLLLQFAVLFLNYCGVVKDQELMEEMMGEALKLSRRVQAECEDLWLKRQANILEASCYLCLNQPGQAVALLEDWDKPHLQEESLLAAAYGMKGDREKALQTLQISLYQNLIISVEEASQFLLYYEKDREKFEEVFVRFETLIRSFHMDRLHPNNASGFYFSAAKGYVSQHNYQRALDMLETGCEILMKYMLPAVLHGDSFFDSIEDWLANLDLGTASPVSEATMKEILAHILDGDTCWDPVRGDVRFKQLAHRLSEKFQSP